VRSELGYDLLAVSVKAAAASVAVSSAVVASSSAAALFFAAASEKEQSITHRSKIQNFGTQEHEKDTNIPSNRSNCCS
jgi:hypothetical protein